MLIRLFIAIAALSFCARAAASPIADQAEASVSWSLGFGGGGLEPALSFSAGLREGPAGQPFQDLLTVRLDRHAAVAALAGLPLAVRSFSTRQAGSEEWEPADAPSVVESTGPWYAQSWVLWTGAGLVAVGVAAVGGEDDSDDNQCTGVCEEECSNNVLSTCNGQFCVQGDEGCLPPNPVISLAAGSRAFDPVETGWDPAGGTGGMGDLIPQAE